MINKKKLEYADRIDAADTKIMDALDLMDEILGDLNDEDDCPLSDDEVSELDDITDEIHDERERYYSLIEQLRGGKY